MSWFFLYLAVSNTTSAPVSSSTVSQGSLVNVVTASSTENSNINLTNSSGTDFGNIQPSEVYTIGINFSIFLSNFCSLYFSLLVLGMSLARNRIGLFGHGFLLFNFIRIL